MSIRGKENHTDFSRVYESYIDDLYAYGKSMGFSHDNCLDAIQDIFFTLYIRNNMAEINNIKYYLFRSLKNKLIDFYKTRINFETEAGMHTLEVTLEKTAVDSLIEEEEQQQLIRNVESLLELLSARQKEAIYLRYMQEFDYEEIGRLMDMNPESVRKLVCRGITRIRENVDGHLLMMLLVLFPIDSF